MSVSAESFRYVCELVRQEAAIELEPGKEYLVSCRLEPLAREYDLTSVDALVAALRRGASPSLKRRMVDALTTNETYFFRDSHPFQALRKQVLPAVIAQRESDRELKVLCAACSTGQEPYTVAMLLREAFPKLADWSITIQANDYSERVLTRARAGIYSQHEVSRGLPAVYLAKYFKRNGAEWRLSETIRDMVTFEQRNITKPWFGLGNFDLILLRNVLIYFADDVKVRVLVEASEHLTDHGRLLLGTGESTLGLDVPLVLEDLGNSRVYRRPNQQRAPRPTPQP